MLFRALWCQNGMELDHEVCGSVPVCIRSAEIFDFVSSLEAPLWLRLTALFSPVVFSLSHHFSASSR